MTHQMKEASQRRRALSCMTNLGWFRVAMMEDWEWTRYKELSIINTVTPEACDLACAISHRVGVAVKAVREEVILVRF